ncbi:MAG TPA: hypothetical protein VM681_06690 [Candidatus Thermoplasmatota archaeon]|nr:hypothetical protein [Candidatus Thermoplasmatota archaeon]
MARLILPVLATAGLVLAGCLGPDSGALLDPQVTDALPLDIDLEVTDAMAFALSAVLPAVHFGHGLYEPTIDVSSSGVIYISAHTTGIDTTGAPAFFSSDDGKTWRQLPFASSARVPEPLHGGTPPPSDEIFIVAGDDGQAWGVDITLATFPVNGWCDDGARHCYHNPNAYDMVQAQTSRAAALTGQDRSCSVANLNDRPWAAYANGKLLMVNNAGGGPVQIGVLKVPPARYVDVWNPLDGPVWNLCAGDGGGFIPGIPDMRADHFFAAPQRQGKMFVVVTGNAANVMDVQQRPVFENAHTSISEISNYGLVAFDAEGTMYVVAMSNEAATPGPGSGGIQIAISKDDGHTFVERTIRFDRPVSSVYIDGNKRGPGAVLNWGLTDTVDGPTDWYLGHLLAGADGSPIVREASLVLKDGPAASRHVQGAAVGPDGRAYMVLSAVHGNDLQDSLSRVGTTPLAVAVQQDGPRLPITIEALAGAIGARTR